MTPTRSRVVLVQTPQQAERHAQMLAIRGARRRNHPRGGPVPDSMTSRSLTGLLLLAGSLLLLTSRVPTDHAEGRVVVGSVLIGVGLARALRHRHRFVTLHVGGSLWGLSAAALSQHWTMIGAAAMLTGSVLLVAWGARHLTVILNGGEDDVPPPRPRPVTPPPTHPAPVSVPRAGLTTPAPAPSEPDDLPYARAQLTRHLEAALAADDPRRAYEARAALDTHLDELQTRFTRAPQTPENRAARTTALAQLLALSAPDPADTQRDLDAYLRFIADKARS